MTPKEKAIELINKYHSLELVELTKITDGLNIGITSKQCALIAVDEILNCPAMNDCKQVKYTDGSYAREYYEVPNKFWSKVKNEIEKL